MPDPVLYGAHYSVYTRLARLALAEKGIAYRLEAVDIFAEGGAPDWYRSLHPFHRIPAFEHDGLKLFETAAITRYVDEAFDGPALQPDEPGKRAVMNQIIGLFDAYAYRAMVWDIYVERVSKPERGETADEAKISAALPVAKTCLDTLDSLKVAGDFLLGDRLTLADIHAAPMFAYFVKTSEGADMLAELPRLETWWNTMRSRPAFTETEFPD